MVKKYTVFLVFFVQGLYLFATPQAPDILMYKGNKYALFENPMESYFNDFPKKRPPAANTALRRGYIATFEIIQNELWVIDITTNSGISIIYDVLDRKNRMKIDWFNGLLFLPHGKLVKYIRYESIYEYYKIIEIEKGNYITEFDLNYEQYDRFSEAQYKISRKIESYEKIYNLLNDGTMPEELLNYFNRVYGE
jgi:hypothetical protein